MIILSFLNVSRAEEYHIWVEPKDVIHMIAEELNKSGVVLTGIGCTQRGVID